MTLQSAWFAFLLLLSPAVGSFLGVLVERLPAGRSLLEPSSCAACGVRLRWRHMVPIASALALRQRCAACGAPYPGHLLRIELAAVLVTVLAGSIASGPVALTMLAGAFWCLVALFYTDLHTLRLPDPLTGALALLAYCWAIQDPSRSLIEPLLSGAGALAAFWLVRWGYFQWRGREGLGLGDVKLAAGLGALVGWAAMPWVTLVAAMLALVLTAVERWRGGGVSHPEARIPFGTYLIGATFVVLMVV
ncbi:Leader peptidase (Prepilin peptidase) [Candidatus Rhodobacter oscarellae]|uniref:Prepilin leader peptidase/N-methyltransferase n=1 Tax=Candidatus Rhodobacter oscarellae TaxID=1675527 RepID=A0A0J9E124_9RHOB|nr:A24 family peptidase [Candidatus Rhodobacter lobularis]KMW56430.1 Leader peptidase (Prepilin peptidase) [Candidatus Rhodobacter lobularis]